MHVGLGGYIHPIQIPSYVNGAQALKTVQSVTNKEMHIKTANKNKQTLREQDKEKCKGVGRSQSSYR